MFLFIHKSAKWKSYKVFVIIANVYFGFCKWSGRQIESSLFLFYDGDQIEKSPSHESKTTDCWPKVTPTHWKLKPTKAHIAVSFVHNSLPEIANNQQISEIDLPRFFSSSPALQSHWAPKTFQTIPNRSNLFKSPSLRSLSDCGFQSIYVGVDFPSHLILTRHKYM